MARAETAVAAAGDGERPSCPTSLCTLLRAVGALLGRGGPASAAALLLADLRDALVRHFDGEESGRFAELRRSHPRFGARIAELTADHDTFRLWSEELVSLAHGLRLHRGRWHELEVSFDELHGALRAHERDARPWRPPWSGYASCKPRRDWQPSREWSPVRARRRDDPHRRAQGGPPSCVAVRGSLESAVQLLLARCVGALPAATRAADSSEPSARWRRARSARRCER
jgi:hypothetical protein